MKIGIDARMYRQSGIGRYIRNLIDNLQKIDKKNEYYLLLLKEDYNTLVYHNNFQKILADCRWYGLAEQRYLPAILDNLKLDCVHFPHFNVPIFYTGKFVVTIHDLIHQHHKMSRATTLDTLTYKIKQFGYRKVFKTAIEKSEKILVPSNYVKNMLSSEWGVRDEKMRVTYEAVDDKILSMVNKMTMADCQRIMQKFNIQPPFIFYVGNAHPHKNVAGLIEAFMVVREKYMNLHLVLSGADHIFWNRIRKQYDKGIIYTGYVDDKTMVALYKRAKCFVMPSFEEGFGIPLLEAMACGCPVVSSNAGSLMEVGGEAVCYFNPKDLNDLTAKITQIMANEKLGQMLIKKGLERYKKFSWERLVEQTLKVYQEVDRD